MPKGTSGTLQYELVTFKESTPTQSRAANGMHCIWNILEKKNCKQHFDQETEIAKQRPVAGEGVLLN